MLRRFILAQFCVRSSPADGADASSFAESRPALKTENKT